MKQNLCLLGILIEITALTICGVIFYHSTCDVRKNEERQIQAMQDYVRSVTDTSDGENVQDGTEKEKSFIKWVDFKVSYDALCLAYELDVESYEDSRQKEADTSMPGEPGTAAAESQGQETVHIDWIELLAYTAARTGGEFGKSACTILEEGAQKLNEGITITELTEKLEYYPYYKEAYSAVLGGLVGEYEIRNDKGVWEKRYGLTGYSPIAKGFDYSDYDDFGVSRSYGYRREHLGHDMMGLVGTPIIAVESGYVEALGWNQYGGWRIGIRSHDGKRYYYYAHLRQNRPYAEGLEEGDEVTAGDVIGYMGHTGYSVTENVNNIDEVHLHFGLQLIFDESQKDGNNEIWVDPYALTRFLTKNRSEVIRNDETKEWKRKYEIRL